MTDLIEVNSKNTAFGTGPLVSILMGTKDGARFLPEQLDSLQAQTHQNWVLIASDDGSSDDTVKILRAYQAKWPAGKLIIKEGPKQGFCINFLTMACDSAIRTDYYAFCDQDDVWLPGKLEIALSVLRESFGVSAMYCGRTIYADERMRQFAFSPKYVFPPSFRNALVQSIAGGNTMVFNECAKHLLEKAGIVSVPSHDWWLYLLVSGSDGLVVFDQDPQVIYRQHKNALVGQNKSILAKLERASMVFSGEFKKFITANTSALTDTPGLISNGNYIWLKLFLRMRESHFKDRLRLLEVSGLYRQTWQGTISLLVAGLFRRI